MNENVEKTFDAGVELLTPVDKIITDLQKEGGFD